MADKETKLSIVVRTVDQATAKIKAINDRLDAATKPIRNFKEALGDLRSKSGLDDVIGGFKGVGSAIGDLLGKVALIGGAVTLAVGYVFHLVSEFDDLGKKAARIGVSVDFLAGLRDAAERAGAPVEALDAGFEAFSANLGQARANAGRMAKFLGLVSPALLAQLKGAKDNATAFGLLADAMAKIQDPAKRAALAQKTLGDAALAPLLMQGSKAINEQVDHYESLAGSQDEAAKGAAGVHESMLDLKASTDGVKAAVVSGLSPALKVLVKQLADWFAGHREDVKEWAVQIGEKLPGAVHAVVDAIGAAVDAIRPFVDSSTKLKIIAVALAAVLVGPLVSAIATLGVALLTTPIGWIVAGIAALGVGAYELIKHWDDVTDFFGELWDDVTEVFEGAWAKIGPIVQKIKDAINWVKDHVDSVLSGSENSAVNIALRAAKQENQRGDGSAVDLAVAAARQQQAAQAVAPNSAQASIKIDIANAPKGTRVTTAPGSTADVDLNVGYQLWGL